MPYINPNANLNLVQDILEPSSVPICHVYWYKDAVPLCSRRKPQGWTGGLSWGHFVRYSNFLGPRFSNVFTMVLHIVTYCLPYFSHVLCFTNVFSVFSHVRYFILQLQICVILHSPATTEVGPATRRKNSRLSTYKMDPGKPVGKVGWVRTSFLGVEQPPIKNPFIFGHL